MMTRALVLAALAGSSFALIAPAAADDAVVFVERPGNMEFTGTMIARPRQDLTIAQRNQAIDMMLPMLDRQYPEVDEFILRVEAQEGAAKGAGENELSRRLMATGLFQYVTPNWRVYPSDTVPNDPQYAQQWHHPKVNAPQAWDITQGLGTIVTAFTDTGIDLSHPDLAAHRIPGYNAVDEIREVDGGQVNDLHGHGTHVAGIGAGIGNNAVGITGMCWNTAIMMVRVSNNASGGSSIEILTRAARWAAENGADVVSTSYTGIADPSIETSGQYIRGLGKLYLWAADNFNTNHSGFDYEHVIIVGATDQNDNKAGFSSYGRAVDVFAPGVDILSTCVGSNYCLMSGTSMATPLVNGIVGLTWSANPALTADMVEEILFESCVDLGAPGNDDFFGWGRTDAFECVQRALALAGPLAPFATDDNAGYKVVGESETIDVLANDFDLNQGDTFILDTFDAVTALGGTVTRSVGTGPGGRDELVYHAPAVGGADSFTYTIRDNTDRTDSATVTVTVVEDSFFRNPDSTAAGEPGIETAYYVTSGTQLPDFSTLTPYMTELQSQINFPQTTGVFAGSGRSDNVGAVFEGFIEVPQTDLYTLYLNSDDGSRMYLGDELIINNDFTHTMLERSAEVALKQGRHRIRVEYFERFTLCGLIVSMSSPGMPKQVVPASMWSHGGDDACGADLSGSSDPNDAGYGVPDGAADAADFFYFLDQFAARNVGAADVSGSSDPNDPGYGVPDGTLDAADFFYYLDLFVAGCP